MLCPMIYENELLDFAPCVILVQQTGKKIHNSMVCELDSLVSVQNIDSFIEQVHSNTASNIMELPMHIVGFIQEKYTFSLSKMELSQPTLMSAKR